MDVLTPPLERSQPRQRLTRWDLAGMVAGLLFTWSITFFLTRGRVFWEDEMLAWMLLRDPSWHHMVWAWKQGADGGGFSFYLTGRAWLHLFGPSELSFRLYSSTCFGLAFAAMWATARRFYSTGVVFFALFNTWFFSPPFIFHMREGRFYGLLTLGVSLAFWLAVVLADQPEGTSTVPGFHIAMFLVHGLLTTSHLLGVVFSAFLIGATILLELLERRWRPLLYLCGVGSWLLLWPERQNILASAAVGKPHFWTKPPTLKEISETYTGSSHEIAFVLVVLLAAVLWSLLRSKAGWRASARAAYEARRPAYIVTGALLLVPMGFLLEGVVGTWLFTPNRYLVPVTIALAFVTAEAVQIIRSHAHRGSVKQQIPGRPALRAIAFAAFIGAMLLWDFWHLRADSPSQVDYTATLTAMLPKGIPVVCEDAFSFTELIGRQHASGVPYVYLLDWQQSLSPSAPRVEVTQYHLMENWRKVGYFSGSIEPIGSFLAQNGRFFVLHSGPIVPTGPPDIGNPLAERLRRNPEYQVVKYAAMNHGSLRDTVWLVCREGCRNYPPLRGANSDQD